MTSHPHVECVSGLFFVKGTRIPVARLHGWHTKGVPVAVLIKRYPSLKPAQLLDALSFGYDHPNLMELDRARLEASGDQTSSGPREFVQLPLPFPKRHWA